MTTIPFTPSETYNWSLSPNALSSSISSDGRILHLTSGAKTDWWRTAPGAFPESDVDRRTGPVYSFDVNANKTQWTAGVWIRGGWKERFQQGTIFIQAGGTIGDGQEKANWLKAGVELEGGQEFVASVVTNPYSDWAVFPAPHSTSWEAKTATADYWVYLQVSRHGPDIILHQGFAPSSSGSGRDAIPPSSPPELTLMREVKGFNILTTEPSLPTGPWKVGVMATGPMSDSTEAAFADFSFKYNDH